MVLAVVFDVAFGEPRRFHPVSGIGKTLGWFRRGTRLPRPWQRTVVGTCGLASVAAAVGALAYAGERLLSSALALPLLALALKPSFSIRRLFEVGNLVEVISKTHISVQNVASAQKLLTTGHDSTSTTG